MDIKLPSNIVKGTLSAKRKDSKYIKGKIQRIELNQKELIQISLFTEQQVYHKNYDEQSVELILIELLTESFTQLELQTKDKIYSYRITSKGKLLTNQRKAESSFIQIEHNKKKNYFLSEGMIIPPLIDLGVMTVDGRLVKARSDKFKQINRFLEIIEDSIKDESYLKIIDFGCGKSYLTFVLYYYLVEVKKIQCDIIGLDLKEEVIDSCNRIAQKYKYNDHLVFQKGNINQFRSVDHIDMIITLHACDTATDYALYHAIDMKCKYIFSVPCCQHEINSQLKTDNLHFMNKFGILKERFSSLVTDSIRANLLQYAGYKTQLMEFVDIENSPKNLLIRAVYTGHVNELAKKEVEEFIQSNLINQTLYNLMFPVKTNTI